MPGLLLLAVEVEEWEEKRKTQLFLATFRSSLWFHLLLGMLMLLLLLGRRGPEEDEDERE